MERINIERTKAVTRTLGSGFEAVVQKVEESRPIAGKESKHESPHAVLGDPIIYATKKPSRDADAVTRPVRMTATAAAAAGALGYDGIGWDKYVTEHYLGFDWETAKKAAKSDMVGKRDLIEEVAIMIEEKGTIFQCDLEEAKKKVAERRRGIYPVRITIYKAGIAKESFITKSLHGEVVVPHLSEELNGLQS